MGYGSFQYTIIGFVIYGSDPQVQLVSWIGLKTVRCDQLLLHVMRKVATKSIISVMDSNNHFWLWIPIHWPTFRTCKSRDASRYLGSSSCWIQSCGYFSVWLSSSCASTRFIFGVLPPGPPAPARQDFRSKFFPIPKRLELFYFFLLLFAFLESQKIRVCSSLWKSLLFEVSEDVDQFV